MTPAATWHFVPEFGREHLLHLPVCGVSCAEERYKFLWSVAPTHVEGKQTAVLAADVTSQALQLSSVMIPGRVDSFYEGQDIGHERYDAVRIKIVGI